MKFSKQNALTIALFAVYFLLLAGIILFKLPFYSSVADERAVNLIPLMGSFDEHGVLVLREVIYNILLFVPLGVYICMLKSGWPKVVPIIRLTLVFEVVQFVFALGRSDITDVLGNTLGGVIGVGIYALLSRLLNGRTVTIVNVVALVVTVCLTVRFAHLFYLSHFVMMRPSL